jgi:hypothetical protein
MNPTVRLLGAFLLSLSLLGCGSGGSGPDPDGGSTLEPTPVATPAEARVDLPLDRTDRYPLPGGVAVGEWIEWRITDRVEKSTSTRRVSVVAEGPDGALWIEEVEDRTVPGESVVWRMLVDPTGRIVSASIGLVGGSSRPIELVESPPSFGDPEEPSGDPRPVTVPAGTFECSEVFDEWIERRTHRSDEVPFDHLVRREEPEQFVELIGFGWTGATRARGE